MRQFLAARCGSRGVRRSCPTYSDSRAGTEHAYTSANVGRGYALRAVGEVPREHPCGEDRDTVAPELGASGQVCVTEHQQWLDCAVEHAEAADPEPLVRAIRHGSSGTTVSLELTAFVAALQRVRENRWAVSAVGRASVMGFPVYLDGRLHSTCTRPFVWISMRPVKVPLPNPLVEAR